MTDVKDVHIVLQGKGGVGKSLVASLLAQYLTDKGRPTACVDTDPINATFSGYKAFGARRVELLDGARIDERRFDAMMESILAEDRHFVVDNGASSFIPLSNYLIENRAIDMIADAGKCVLLHTVVTGGQALLDTVAGFSRLASQMPERAGIVVWLNEYFGRVVSDGKTFEQMKAYQTHKARVVGIVRLEKRTSDTFVRDMEEMLDGKRTFAEAVASPETGVMAKQRLTMMRREAFGQMAAAGL
jgi:hypothetical protein